MATTSILVQHDGCWWPATDTDARGVLTSDVRTAIPALMRHIQGRDLIVQAGGNVGLFPIALRDAGFQRVETFEPDPTNYECLLLNLYQTDAGKHGWRIWHHRAALGERIGFCEMVSVQRANCGAHRVEFEGGAIPVLTIDEQALPACDAIWLDLEGAELPALKGAADTIERFSPVIAVEDKGLHRAFGIADGALREWLTERGYEQVDKIGQDKVWKRRVG